MSLDPSRNMINLPLPSFLLKRSLWVIAMPEQEDIDLGKVARILRLIRELKGEEKAYLIDFLHIFPVIDFKDPVLPLSYLKFALDGRFYVDAVMKWIDERIDRWLEDYEGLLKAKERKKQEAKGKGNGNSFDYLA